MTRPHTTRAPTRAPKGSARCGSGNGPEGWIGARTAPIQVRSRTSLGVDVGPIRLERHLPCEHRPSDVGSELGRIFDRVIWHRPVSARTRRSPGSNERTGCHMASHTMRHDRCRRPQQWQGSARPQQSQRLAQGPYWTTHPVSSTHWLGFEVELTRPMSVLAAVGPPRLRRPSGTARERHKLCRV
jgi:hypothetical protein